MKKFSFKQMNLFTLIELLVVVAIIGILISMLFPSLRMARAKTNVAVCKSNMRQVGVGINLYISDNSLIVPLPFQQGTGDHPREGDIARKGSYFPGNPAIYTYEYYQNNLEDIFICPLVDIAGESFDKAPFTGGSWSSGDGFWSTSIYIYGKSLPGNDPFGDKRSAAGGNTFNSLTSVNEISEKLVMIDYPQKRATSTWYPSWRTSFEHYNALMEDGSVKEPAKNYTNFNLWMWGKTTW